MLQEAYAPLPPSRALVPAQVGRPTKFKMEYCESVEKLGKLGATDAQIASFFGVSKSTLYLWKIQHEEFSEAEKRGKIIADMEVANFLHMKATGMLPKDAGDTTAAIFWLKNRQRLTWNDRKEVDVAVTVRHENMLDRVRQLEIEGKL